MAFQRFFGAFHPPYTVELKYILIFVLFTMFVHQTKKKNIEITWLAKKVKQSIFSPHINIAAMQILNLISVPTLISENSAIAESVKSKKQTDGKKN